MTTTLESMTKQYGCRILFSGDFRSILSAETKKLSNIRCVDQIMSQVDKKHELYTFDMGDELNRLPATNEIGGLPNKDFYNLQLNKRFRKMQMIAETDTSMQMPFFKLFEEDLQLSLVSEYHRNYQQKADQASSIEMVNKKFKEAMNHYILGDWEEAGQQLQEVLKDSPHDGPTKFLLKFVKDNQDPLTKRPPEDWIGYRRMDSC